MQSPRQTLTQKIVLLLSLAFVAVTVLGFVSTGMHAGEMRASGGGGAPAMILGLFPTSIAHNLVHLVFGVWGLWASRNTRRAVNYAFASGAIYLVLALIGMFVPNVFGLIPIGGLDIPLHAGIALALIAAAFGSLFASAGLASEPAAGD